MLHAPIAVNNVVLGDDWAYKWIRHEIRLKFLGNPNLGSSSKIILIYDENVLSYLADNIVDRSNSLDGNVLNQF